MRYIPPTAYVRLLSEAIDALAERYGAERVGGGRLVTHLSLCWGFVADDLVLVGYPPVQSSSLQEWIHLARRDEQDLAFWEGRRAPDISRLWVTFAARRSSVGHQVTVLRDSSGDWEAILRWGLEAKRP